MASLPGSSFSVEFFAVGELNSARLSASSETVTFLELFAVFLKLELLRGSSGGEDCEMWSVKSRKGRPQLMDSTKGKKEI